jgi:hypothetical protein
MDIVVPGVAIGLLLTLVIGLVLVFLPERFLPEGDPPGAELLGGLVLVFAFVLGLTVAQETSNLSSASSAASVEANNVGELYWFAHSLPEPEHSQLQGLLRAYATIVAKDEWPLLKKGQTSPKASAAVRAIRNDLIAFTPSTPKQDDMYRNALNQVSDLFNARRNRTALAAGGVPPILLHGLAVLVAGILLATPLIGSLKKPRVLTLYGLFAIMTVCTLFLVKDLNHTYSGPVAVGPDAFTILFKGVFVNVR